MRQAFAVMSWLLVLAAVGAGAARAAEQTVTYPSGKDKLSALLATPAGKGPFPAVIVIQEWWGVNDWIKEQARALAKEGYVALAADLYRGKVAEKQEEAHQFMMGLPPEQAVGDLKAAFDYLASRPDVKKDRIGAVGWCMGGAYTLQLAVNEPRLAAAVPYYGRPPQEADVAKIKAPVLGNYGGTDEGPSPAQVKAFEETMKKAGKTVDIKIYEGAPHAFANPNNPWKGYRPEAAKDAWSRTLGWFEKYLKKAS